MKFIFMDVIDAELSANTCASTVRNSSWNIGDISNQWYKVSQP